MQIITTHKGTDFDAAASVLAAKILYPEAVAVLPKSGCGTAQKPESER